MTPGKWGKWTKFIHENPDLEMLCVTIEPKAAGDYAKSVYEFIEWIKDDTVLGGMSLAELLDYQDKAVRRDNRRIASKIAEWGTDYWGRKKKARASTIMKYTRIVRRVFSYHGVSLPEQRILIPEESPVKTENLLSRDALIKILNRASLRDRTMYLCAFQGGMGFRELNEFNRSYHSQIREQIQNYKSRIVIRLSPRKQNRANGDPFFTVLGTDATKMLKDYLRHRGEPKEGEAIFKLKKTWKSDGFISDRTYGAVFRTLCTQVGLIDPAKPQNEPKQRGNRYGYNPHNLRDLFKSEWVQTTAKLIVADFMMGHEIDSNEYLKIKNVDFVKEEVSKAEARLNIISRPDLGSVPAEEVDVIREQMREQQRQLDYLMQKAQEYPEEFADNPELFTNPDFADPDSKEGPEKWKQK